MQGYRLGWVRLRGLERSAERALGAVRLRGRCEIHNHLGKGQIALWRSEVMKSIARGHGDLQRLRIGETHVLGCHGDRSAEHDHRVRATLDHARHPV